MKFSRFGDHDESVGLLFWQVSTLWQREVKQALRALNLTHTQYVVLAVVQYFREKNMDVNQKVIADLSMIDKMTTSGVLRLLEKKRLIERREHPDDTRAKQIFNTPWGTQLLRQAVQVVENIDCTFFFRNNESREEFKGMLKAVKKLHDY